MANRPRIKAKEQGLPIKVKQELIKRVFGDKPSTKEYKEAMSLLNKRTITIIL